LNTLVPIIMCIGNCAGHRLNQGNGQLNFYSKKDLTPFLRVPPGQIKRKDWIIIKEKRLSLLVDIR